MLQKKKIKFLLSLLNPIQKMFFVHCEIVFCAVKTLWCSLLLSKLYQGSRFCVRTFVLYAALNNNVLNLKKSWILLVPSIELVIDIKSKKLVENAFKKENENLIISQIIFCFFIYTIVILENRKNGNRLEDVTTKIFHMINTKWLYSLQIHKSK